MIKLILVGSFSLLWAIWMQPHTIALRYILLSIGSLLGLYVISQNLRLLTTKRAIPILLIALLFAWVTFHLFFLSHRYELQLNEYITIWRRIAWEAPFAVGLGILLGLSRYNKSQAEGAVLSKYPAAWWIFYGGLITPPIIYLIRWLMMFLAGKFGWQLPDFAIQAPPLSSWYIPKMSTVFFCLPALALACSQCFRLAKEKTQHLYPLDVLYFGTILSVFFVFYLENTKNGFVYSVILILTLLTKIILLRKSKWSCRQSYLILVAFVALGLLVATHLQKNESWKTLIVDVKVAGKLEEIDSWKYYGAKGYPKNELGQMVSVTNYERAAWARVALEFIYELPLGYGLIYKSFGYYGEDKWPDSTLYQAHSAWLDLTLGIGIPGVFLLVLAGGLALKNAHNIVPSFWGEVALWILSSIALLMITTEVSQQFYLEALIFMILWAAGIGLCRPANKVDLVT